MAANPSIEDSEMTQDTRSQSQPGYDGERAASVGAEPSAGTETDPLDVPLHCDIRINHIVYRKGVKLRTLVNAATRWHSMLSASPPSPPAVWSGEDSLSLSQPCGDGPQPVLPPVAEPSAAATRRVFKALGPYICEMSEEEALEEIQAAILDIERPATGRRWDPSAAWRPIETAPRDGTVVLVWKEPGFRTAPICAAFWCDDVDALVSAEDRSRVWKTTHWQPLPEAPR